MVGQAGGVGELTLAVFYILHTPRLIVVTCSVFPQIIV